MKQKPVYFAVVSGNMNLMVFFNIKSCYQKQLSRITLKSSNHTVPMYLALLVFLLVPFKLWS